MKVKVKVNEYQKGTEKKKEMRKKKINTKVKLKE